MKAAHLKISRNALSWTGGSLLVSAFIASVFSSFFSSTSALAVGGGSVVGNGGGSLVCFKSADLKQYVEEGLLRKNADRAITSAVALEYFIANATDDLDPDIAAYAARDDWASVSNVVMQRTFTARVFGDRVRYASQHMIEFNRILGDLVQPDYHDTHDWSTPVPFPIGCTRVQTAIRYDTFLYYEPVIWSRLSNTQKLLIRFHEYIYYIGVKELNMDSSRPTQDLLTYLLSKHFTPAGLRSKLLSTGFVLKPLDFIQL